MPTDLGTRIVHEYTQNGRPYIRVSDDSSRWTMLGETQHIALNADDIAKVCFAFLSECQRNMILPDAELNAPVPPECFNAILASLQRFIDMADPDGPF